MPDTGSHNIAESVQNARQHLSKHHMMRCAAQHTLQLGSQYPLTSSPMDKLPAVWPIRMEPVGKLKVAWGQPQP